MDELNYFMRHPLVLAVIASVIPAIQGDLACFQAFQSFEDAAQFNWKVFAFRVVKGVALGVFGYFGVLGAVTSATTLVP